VTLRANFSGPAGSRKRWCGAVAGASQFLNLATHAFELFNKSGDFLENTLLDGEIFGIQRTHLGQDAVEFGAVLAGLFPLQ